MLHEAVFSCIVEYLPCNHSDLAYQHLYLQLLQLLRPNWTTSTQTKLAAADHLMAMLHLQIGLGRKTSSHQFNELFAFLLQSLYVQLTCHDLLIATEQ
jgi:hypothetical protein